MHACVYVWICDAMSFTRGTTSSKSPTKGQAEFVSLAVLRSAQALGIPCSLCVPGWQRAEGRGQTWIWHRGAGCAWTLHLHICSTGVNDPNYFYGYCFDTQVYVETRLTEKRECCSDERYVLTILFASADHFQRIRSIAGNRFLAQDVLLGFCGLHYPLHIR